MFFGGRTPRDSPLIFDMDRDGRISAVKGIGVNMNSADPTIRNGAATDGDKMLAMCEFSGNGEIDYREVFGDGTVDPFTHRPLNADNGFIALHRVAESAQSQNLDLKLFSRSGDGSLLVDLPQLKTALQRIGCDLGVISDENTRQLEPLSDIEWVQVTNYQQDDNDEHDGIRFAQKGWYLDSAGRRFGVDDVWFPATA